MSGTILFFSSQHKTFSRIRYILISAPLLYSVLDTNILPMLISDHSPVKITIYKSHSSSHFKRWRFNVFLLQDAQFLKHIRNYLSDFILLNMSSDVNPHTLWEAAKCIIRGSCISYSSKLVAIRKQKISSLEKKQYNKWNSCRNSVMIRIELKHWSL